MVFDVDVARHNMITQQLRTCDVLNEDVLQAMAAIPRQTFVPAGYYELAFADMHIPLAHGQMMMTPLEEATVLQALAIQPTDTVLEIGSGCGYLTAVLAQLAQQVVSLDSSAHIVSMVSDKLTKQGVTNVKMVIGNELQGAAAHGPFDVIVINGSLPKLTQAATLREQLTPDGRLFVVVGQGNTMHGLLLSHTDQDWQQTVLFDTQLPPLPSVAVSEEFVF